MPSFTSATALLLGLSATLAAAAPWGPPHGAPWGPESWHGGNQPSPAADSVPPFPTESANNFVSPDLSNGFPNIANPSEALTEIEHQAHGTLPNSPLPPSLSDATKGALRLIAFNEIFEVAYFTALVQNVTENVAGYGVENVGVKDFVLNALIAVQAQEELHALDANAALQAFGADPIQPCEYKFPVSDFASAINLAATFTDLVLGTLQDAEFVFGQAGDIGLLKPVAAIIGQEGEQNGFYRSILGKIPSALPFLTASTPQFAFSALNQMFVVPGSCPNSNTIDLPVFGALTVVNAPTAPVDTQVQFSVPSSGYSSLDSLSVAYINQQNVPVVEPITAVSQCGDQFTFTANFPGATNLLNGLTIAAVTKGSGPFATPDDVAAAAVFGPGLIEIN